MNPSIFNNRPLSSLYKEDLLHFPEKYETICVWMVSKDLHGSRTTIHISETVAHGEGVLDKVVRTLFRLNFRLNNFCISYVSIFFAS